MRSTKNKDGIKMDSTKEVQHALLLVSQLGKLIIGDTIYVTAGEGIINDI